MYINFFPTQNSNFFCFQWFSKQFTKDYLSNYAIQDEATKVKVFRKDRDELDVVLKIVKNGRAVITKGWTKVVKALHMKEGSIWVFRFSNFNNNLKQFTPLFTVSKFVLLSAISMRFYLVLYIVLLNWIMCTC